MSVFTEMEVFAAVIQTNSFTNAAEKLGLSKSYVSKIVSHLEQKLGAKLIYRSTRKLSLTEVGATFFNHCQRMQTQAETALNEVSLAQNSTKGTLRITAPHGMATQLLPNIINKLLSQYSGLKIELDSTNELVDIIGQGVDLALRMGSLRSSELVAKKITNINNVLCASSEYCARSDLPITPYDLTTTPVAFYNRLSASKEVLEFEHKQEKLLIQVSPILKSNNSTVIKKFVLDHGGISVLPEYLISDELQSGKLIRLLPKYQLANSPLYAVYPSRKFVNYKTKILISALQKHFEKK